MTIQVTPQMIRNLHASKAATRKAIIAQEEAYRAEEARKVKAEAERKAHAARELALQHRKARNMAIDAAMDKAAQTLTQEVLNDLHAMVMVQSPETYPFHAGTIDLTDEGTHTQAAIDNLYSNWGRPWVRAYVYDTAGEEFVYKHKNWRSVKVAEYLKRGGRSIDPAEGWPMDNVLKHILYGKVKEVLESMGFEATVPRLILPAGRRLNLIIGSRFSINLG